MMSDIGEAAAAKVQPSLTSRNVEKELSEITAIEKTLPMAVIESYSPALQKMQTELADLLSKQNRLIVKMEVENKQLTETAEDERCSQMYPIIKTYYEKLSRIKKEMSSVHDRSVKLKKRALRLQQIKQKEALTRQQIRQDAIRYEEDLIGKPGTNV